MTNIEKMLISDDDSIKIFASTINTLKLSQGFYKRLCEDINTLDEDDFKYLCDDLSNKDFIDMLDVVMYLEG